MSRRTVSLLLALFFVNFAAGRWWKQRQGSMEAENLAPNTYLINTETSDTKIAGEISSQLESLQNLANSDDCIARWDATTGIVERRLLLARWSVLDPQGAAAFLSGNALFEDLSTLLKLWITRDPHAALTHYRAERGNWSRNGPWEHELYGLVLEYHGPESMIDLAMEFDMRMQSNDVTQFDDAFKQWATKDLASAMAKASALERDRRANVYAGGLPRASAFGGIGQALAERDLQKAISWAGGLEDDDRQSALHGILSELALKDPDAVLPYLEELETPFEFSGRIKGAGSVAVMELVRKDPANALQWIADNVSPAEKHHVIDIVFSQAILSSSPHMLAEAIAGVDDAAAQQWAIDSIGNFSDDKDINAALDGTLALPEENPIRNRLMESLLDTWAKTNPSQARRHLEADSDRYGDIGHRIMDGLSESQGSSISAQAEPMVLGE